MKSFFQKIKVNVLKYSLNDLKTFDELSLIINDTSCVASPKTIFEILKNFKHILVSEETIYETLEKLKFKLDTYYVMENDNYFEFDGNNDSWFHDIGFHSDLFELLFDYQNKYYQIIFFKKHEIIFR
jgi:hypothetical protein